MLKKPKKPLSENMPSIAPAKGFAATGVGAGAAVGLVAGVLAASIAAAIASDGACEEEAVAVAVVEGAAFCLLGLYGFAAPTLTAFANSFASGSSVIGATACLNPEGTCRYE